MLPLAKTIINKHRLSLSPPSHPSLTLPSSSFKSSISNPFTRPADNCCCPIFYPQCSEGTRSPHRVSQPSSAHRKFIYKMEAPNRALEQFRRLHANFAESSARVEQNWEFWAKYNGADIDATKIPKRMKLNGQGKPIPVKINCWEVDTTKLCNGSTKIYQYDIDFKNGKGREPTLRKIKERCWNDRAVQALIPSPNTFVYDGNKIGWSDTHIEKEIVQEIDLNVQEGKKQSKPDSPNRVTVTIKFAKKLDFTSMANMLQGKDEIRNKASTLDATDLDRNQTFWGETLNFLEHVLHQSPRRNMVILKKSFFRKAEKAAKEPNINDRADLGYGVDAVKGVYVSFKPTFQEFDSQNKPRRTLSLVVDVANCAFFRPGMLKALLPAYLGMSNTQTLENDFKRDMETAWKNAKNDREAQKAYYDGTRTGKAMSRFRRVRMNPRHLKSKDVNVFEAEKGISDIVPKSPHQHYFEQEENGKVTKISVAAYFKKKYGIVVGHFPMVAVKKRQLKIGKDGKKVLDKDGEPVFTEMIDYFPMEVVAISPDQRYPFKLDERQTSAMLNFAVTLPKARWDSIQKAVHSMNWPQDPYLKHYGMVVKNAESPVHLKDARLLNCPSVDFQNGKILAKETQSGRWRIDGKKFDRTNSVQPKTWAIAIQKDRRGPCITTAQAQGFATSFVKIFAGHGGRMANPKPAIFSGDFLRGTTTFDEFANEIKKTATSKPELLFFVVPDRNVETYNGIKRHCDLRWGTASQVMASKHFKNGKEPSGQYISNICMKVNAKLGGATCRAGTALTNVTKFYEPGQGILVLGADVTHASPGSNDPSIAALVASADHKFNRFHAQVESNGERVEMISTNAIKKMFREILKIWCPANKMAPQTIIYVRDGVSNEQAYKVIAEEVRDLKKAFEDYMKSLNKTGTLTPKFTVLIATKRHHVRFFPDRGDQNGNPIPGTLVEKGVTLANEYDWYLNSHVALKGTARPVHYRMILDEKGYPVELLQQFIFENSFQYIRSTTPVSMFPAVYYAHLAAYRAKPHADMASLLTESKRVEMRILQGEDSRKVFADARSGGEDPATINLLPLNDSLKNVMWYA
ncbi:Piwi-domain-containing protein [Microthyrium microscopicum]|uniref:Piwi-domain-containing protein n=1 Tax=Microthyrium microscopicum TaxID=703497 RepID=A0A6A6U4C6_9PEZI|nr:Piwi-domain-containing protein [Microthyrium microscopicum]